jgi:hypothetical protein
MVPIWVLLATLILVAFAAGRMAQSTAVVPTGMVAAFVDTNGNDIDDACETAPVEPDEDAAKAAEEAVDTDGDGTISVSEAAHSGRIGGKNCNHGGYVSWVAQGSCADATPTPAEPALVTGPEPGDGTEAAATESSTCDEQAEGATEDASDEAADAGSDEQEAADATCEEVAPPERDPALDEQKNGHGKWVSTVAQSDAIGGKNCNHGGAVSEAAKKDHEADKAARDAAKAERKAAREAAKAARAAAKAAREHGTGKPQSD